MTIDFVAQFGPDGEAITELEQMDTPTIDGLVTCARLRMRYSTGPMRRRLDQQLLRWNIDETSLHQITRDHWAHYSQAKPIDTVAYGSGSDTETQ